MAVCGERVKEEDAAMGFRMMIASDEKDGAGGRVRSWIKKNVFGDRNPVVPKGKQNTLDDAAEEPNKVDVMEEEPQEPPKEAGFKKMMKRRMA